MIFEITYYLVAIVILYRLNKALHRNIFEDDLGQHYVKSDTTKWCGWVKRTKH